MITRAKRAHYESVLSSLDQRTCFRVVNTLLKPPSTSRPQSSSNKLCSDFATYFAEKTQGIRVQIQKKLISYTEFSDSVFDISSHPVSYQLNRLLHTTDEELRNIIKLCPSTTCSLDACPTELLKRTLNIHIPYLVAIVNNSFEQGIFPNTLRTAVVKPLLKSDTINKDQLKNYRPVSNIAFIGKVLEKVAVHRLTEHLTMNGLHEEYQSAYKTLHSTETALLGVKHDIAGALDRDHAMVFVMLYLSAAFDTIDHAHLLKLLQDEYGVRGTGLLGSRHTWKTATIASRLTQQHHSSVVYHRARSLGQLCLLCTTRQCSAYSEYITTNMRMTFNYMYPTIQLCRATKLKQWGDWHTALRKLDDGWLFVC